MRAFILLLLIPLSMAADANITYHLGLEMAASCPGNILSVDAMASNGASVSDVELRLVLYYPYQGLRALKHTDVNGQTFFELTKNGTYRVYIKTDAYDHEQYEEFDYPELCPPPPPKEMNVSASFDCESSIISVNVTESGEPLAGVFVRSLRWSSMSGSLGIASLPLEGDDYFVVSEKEGYGTQTIFLENVCSEPPVAGE